MQNPESGECTTLRLTLGLSKNGPRANLDTSQRLTLGLSENAPRANPATSLATDPRITCSKMSQGQNAAPSDGPWDW